MDKYKAAVRARREARNLSVEDVATALGVAPEQYAAWERGHSSEHVGQWDALRVLHEDLLGLVAPDTQRAVPKLAHLWGAWGPGGGARAAALAQISAWARQDDRLSANATVMPFEGMHDCVASRGVPEAGPSIFTAASLPPLGAVPLGDLDCEEASTAGRALADVITSTWVPAGQEFDPWQVADTFAVAAGLAPLGENARAVSVAVGQGHAVVVNSDLEPPQRTAALTHALIHIALGHVPVALVASSPKDGGLTGASCTGCGYSRCALVRHAAAWLLERDASTPPRRTPPRTVTPEPVRAPGEAPGYWEAYDVTVRRVSLSRELGLHHLEFLKRGAGESTWPASLARRWLAVAARQGAAVEAVRNFPFRAPGCPSVEQVETALHQGRIVEAQLAAWNDAQIAGSLAHAAAERDAARAGREVPAPAGDEQPA